MHNDNRFRWCFFCQRANVRCFFEYTCSLFGRCVYTCYFCPIVYYVQCTQVSDRSQWFGIPKNKRIPSQKLTFSPLKMDGWFRFSPASFWDPTTYFQGRVGKLLVSGSDVLRFPAPIQPWKCWGWKVTRQLEDRWHIHGWISCLETLFGFFCWGGDNEVEAKGALAWHGFPLKGPESRVYMDVSENSGFSPKSSILIRFSIINHPFCFTPILGNIHIEPVVHIAWWNPTSTDYVP